MGAEVAGRGAAAIGEGGGIKSVALLGRAAVGETAEDVTASGGAAATELTAGAAGTWFGMFDGVAGVSLLDCCGVEKVLLKYHPNPASSKALNPITAPAQRNLFIPPIRVDGMSLSRMAAWT